MTPLPLGGSDLVAWRLDQAKFAATWDSGEGAYKLGGRWNNKGIRAMYCSIDPATAILEVAVHKGFKALDTVPHVLTSLTISELESVHIVHPEHVPNSNWLKSGIFSAGQQDFGDNLLAQYKFVVIPSAVSSYSWNLIFDSTSAAGSYALRSQQPFALDTRLDPPTAP
jgi:RES domain-containing protein